MALAGLQWCATYDAIHWAFTHAVTSAERQRVQRVPILTGCGNVPAATLRLMDDGDSPIFPLTVPILSNAWSL
jgi:hypothetical protein